MLMFPEEKARLKINRKLLASGWFFADRKNYSQLQLLIIAFYYLCNCNQVKNERYCEGRSFEWEIKQTNKY